MNKTTKEQLRIWKENLRIMSKEQLLDKIRLIDERDHTDPSVYAEVENKILSKKSCYYVVTGIDKDTQKKVLVNCSEDRSYEFGEVDIYWYTSDFNDLENYFKNSMTKSEAEEMLSCVLEDIDAGIWNCNLKDLQIEIITK